MRITQLLPALALALPAVAVSQRAAQQPAKTPQSLLDQIRANVAKVTDAPEKERWQGNIDLWQTKLARTDKLAAADIDKMNASLKTIRANVAKVTEPAEKARWTANADLWTAFLALKDTPAKTEIDHMNGLVAAITSNVAKVTAADEKERWMANRDLWKTTIDKLGKP